ncbi:MAG: TerB family tellurite resistance protein [Moritella sp.]|uniref:tellurite resistance TerB family protein n=1 Tax=Moritella sp. TaxID=78556 RepID=UPI001DC9E31E|nr:TerB family tellurite resistance protein [Moritella sp.]NQZ51914.1 TerB family tellurite resistance protein [Moritella sp.]
MFKAIQNLFKQLSNDTSLPGAVDIQEFELSMAALLCEVASADSTINEKESAAKVHQLSLLLGIDKDRARELLAIAIKDSEESISIYEFTSKLRNVEYKQRNVLIESMWHVAYADGVIDPHEEALIRQVADLIYVTHSDYIKAKLATLTESL